MMKIKEYGRENLKAGDVVSWPGLSGYAVVQPFDGDWPKITENGTTYLGVRTTSVFDSGTATGYQHIDRATITWVDPK